MATAGESVGERVRAAFTENLNLKLLSFLFAMVLYSLVHGGQDAQKSVPVPIVWLTPPDSGTRMLVSPLPPQVRVRMSGPRNLLDDVDVGTLQLDVRSGARRVLLEPQLIPVPPGVRVVQIDPPAIDLEWEDRVVRDLPVQVGLINTPAPGFVVQGAPAAEPRIARVHGPKSEVATLTYVKTFDAFDVQGLAEGKYTRQLDLDRPRGHVALDTDLVTATVVIAREVVSQSIPVVLLHVTGNVRARPNRTDVAVQVTCPQGVSVHRDQLIATVEAPSSPPSGAVLVPVNIVAPRDCRVTANPPQVLLRW